MRSGGDLAEFDKKRIIDHDFANNHTGCPELKMTLSRALLKKLMSQAATCDGKQIKTTIKGQD